MSGHLINTRPVCAPCPRCHRLQWTGHDGGLSYRVEPVPVTVLAELAALVAGVRSYALIGGHLVARTVDAMRADLRRPRPPVVLDHRCSRPIPAADVEPRHVSAVARQLGVRDGPAPAERAALDLLTRHLGARELPPY